MNAARALVHRASIARVVCRSAAILVASAPITCGRRAELLGTIVSPRDGPATEAGGARPQFSAPQLVSAVSDPTAYDADPSVTGDLLEMFFMSDRSGSKDIWTSRRASTTDPWGPPSIVPNLNSPASDEGPSISLDGTRIWFATDRQGPSRHIWSSTRASRNDPWAAPSLVAELAGMADDFGPAIDATETTMFFNSNRSPAAAYDVFSSTRPSASAPWGAPMQVPGVNGPFDDKDPFVAEGGLIIFFTSSRTGAGDLFWSTRQSTAEPFSSPLPLVELNSPAYDSDPSLSQDLTYILFDSQRTGISDIYESHSIP